MDKSSGSTPGSHAPHEREVLERNLLSAIKNRRDDLVQLFDKVSGHWSYKDPVYRFYHQSFKVFALQETTLQSDRELIRAHLMRRRCWKRRRSPARSKGGACVLSLHWPWWNRRTRHGVAFPAA